ncbi:MAG TPA: TetR/AcrR family transcriptional regulator [Tepidisphaeraceae bacterium]|nr:TetR/AcrR family transcriptional regulator [Tepidisphaeraceae bacterium]
MKSPKQVDRSLAPPAVGVHLKYTLGLGVAKLQIMPNTRTKSVAELLGLPDPPKTGRERLVAAAVDLFYRNGFAAVGIDRVIEAAGVTKTTFYKHFEGKDDLMVAAVQRRDEWESQAWAKAIHKRAGDDPIKQLLAMFDVMDIWFNDPDFLGCMFLNTAIEFPNPHDPVHQAAASYKRKVRDHWRDVAKAAGAQTTAAETFADCYSALIEGALILRQTHGRNDAARAIRPAVEQLINTYLRNNLGPPTTEKPPIRITRKLTRVDNS